MPRDRCPFALFAVWLAASYLIFAGPVAAQNGLSGEPPRVVAVRVVTESGTVLEQNPSDLTVQPSQPYSLETESASLRELYRSGRFADLRAELTDVTGGVRLDFVVRQNFYINKVQIDGLREPPGEGLALSALRLNVGETFQDSDMKEALDRLRQTLGDDGEYQAKVDYQTTPHPETLQVDILVRVTPGPRARISSITIQNQTQFPDEELLTRLKLKEGKQITSDLVNRAADRERKWLAGKNYLGARVTVHRGIYDPNSNGVTVDFTIYAGLEVRVAVEGAKISIRTLRKLVPIYQEGAVENISNARDTSTLR
jgi:outer membrane protein insertion porin family